MTIDIIILSYCINEEIWEMNNNCISSLINSETNHTFNILVIESYKEFTRKYQFDNVKVIIPTENFNFNKYLNIGLKQTNNELICFCNNDLVFSKNWFSNILEVKIDNPHIQSFSPNHKDYYKTNAKTKFALGYNIRQEFTGYCFLVVREIFNIIGEFDEYFDYYMQDDDFVMGLRKHNIKHALVIKSNVTHLGSKTGSIVKGYNYFERIENDRKKYHKKWGSQRSIAYKNRFVYLLKLFGFGNLSKFIY